MNQEIENKDMTSTPVQDVLLVRDKSKKTIQVVQNLEKDGTMNTVAATKKNQPQFMRIDRNGDFISNFFSNFMTQLQNPTNFSFFKVPAENALEVVKKVQKQLKDPNPLTEKTLANYEIRTTPEQETNRFKEEQIDWDSLKKLGLDKDFLEKRHLLEPLLKGFKTNELVPINLKLGMATIRTDARLSLQTNEEGKVIAAIHGIRKEPNLNQAFFGHSFSEEDKKNLLETGNMGRVVPLTHLKTNEQIPSIISVDRLTNELVALRTDYIKVPDEIKSVVLSPQQKQLVAEGKPLHLDGMLSKKGTEFSATLQYNADKRYIEFLFDRNNAPKQTLNSTQNPSQEVPKTFRGKELDQEQYDKFKEGHTVYLSGLVDKKGKEYNGYITLNKATNKTDFTFQNPNKVKEHVKPTEAHTTQTAVNSEGKNNEATKSLKEPLKSGQANPDTQKQQKEQEHTKEVVKSKGRKI